MANTKISLLTALTGANVAPATDLIPIVDTSATETKQITVAQLLIGMGVTGTNTGDETTATIKTKLGITTLSGSNTGDQDLSSYLTSATAASTYLTQANAASTYFTIANASTTNIAEGSNLYFTEARVLGTDLAGLSITGGAITSSDLVLAAFGKLQNQINAVLGGAAYQGVWNATTNSPSLSSGVGTQGYYYVVSVAGSTNLDGITDWKVGDWAIFNGTTWDKVDNTDAVSSVDGMIGAVSLSGTYQALSSNLTSFATVTPSANGLSFVSAANYSAMKTLLNLSGTNTGDQTITLQGDVTGTGTGTFTTTIAAGAVDIAMLSATGTPSATTYLRGDGTWSTPSGGGGGSTFADNAFQVYDSVDNTKILAFEAGSITTATTRTLTIPDASGTITLNDSTATLTNKTLTAPKFASGGFIADANGNELLEFESVASAVNHLKIVNDITNGDPYIEVVGDDANVGMYMVMKGSGFFALDSSTQTTGSSRGAYACDLQIFRSSASHIASGNYAFAANYQNTASGNFASVFGNSSTASAQGAFVIGQSNTGAGQDSFTGGFRARAAMRAQFAWSGGMHSTGGNSGDNQYSLLVARRYITGATTGQTGITLYINDGTSGEIIPDVTSLTYRTWTLRVQWNVVISATSGTTTGLAAADTVGAMDIIVLKKTGSTVTVVETSLGTVYGDTNMKTGLSMGYTASGTNFRINLVAPTFAGGGSLTLKASAVLHISENGY